MEMNQNQPEACPTAWVVACLTSEPGALCEAYRLTREIVRRRKKFHAPWLMVGAPVRQSNHLKW